MRPPAREDKVVRVLFVPPRSASLRSDRFSARIGTRTLLEWWIERVSRPGRPKPFVLFHSPHQQEALTRLCQPAAIAWRSQYSCMDAALAEGIRAQKAEHVVLLTLASAFLPPSLVDAAESRHLTDQADVTYTRGLPSGVGPWILSACYLEWLRTIEAESLPSHPGQAFLRLRSQMKGLPRGLAADRPDIAQMRECRIELRAEYGNALAELPQSIFLESEQELKLACEVASALPTPAGLEALHLWKKLDLARKAEPPPPPAPVMRRHNQARILYLANACAYSGAEQSLAQLLAAIDPAKFERIALLGASGHLEQILRAAGVATMVCEDGFAECTARSFLSLSRTLEDLRPDLIHANGIEGIAALALARSHRIPFVQHVRNGNVTPYKEYVEASAAVIAVSEYVRERLLRFAIARDRICVVPDEVDTGYFHSCPDLGAALRSRYSVAPGAKTIAMIARYDCDKRHDLLLKAFHLVRRREPRALLLLAGEAYWENRYHDAVRQWISPGIDDKSIVVLPFLPDVQELHRMADVLVLCSENEGLGRSIIEAMAMAVPVVITRLGGRQEAILDGVTGLIVDHDSPESLAGGILRVLTDAPLAHSLGSAARSYVKEHFTAGLSARRIEALYKSVLA